MEWASAVSERASLAVALEEACSLLDAAWGPGAAPDLVIAFASPHHDLLSTPLGPRLRRRFPGARVLGCTGAGVIGGGHEVEGGPGLSLTAARLPQVHLHTFHLLADQLPSPDAPPDAWAERLGVPLDAAPHFLLLADPFSLDSEALVAGLDYAWPGAAKIGGLASGGRGPRTHALYQDDLLFREGVVGVALWGDVVVDTVVAQGCRPVGERLRVSAAVGPLLMGLDGRSPVDVLGEIFRAASPRDQELMQRNLFIGIAADALGLEPGAGDYLVRNLTGVDPKRGALTVGAHLHEGQEVRFHVRDAQTSAEDLRDALARYAHAAAGEPATGAVLFSCTGRGRLLYGEGDHDSGLFRALMGEGAVPLGGFFCNGEIGPVGGATHLHTYTSSFGIFRPRSR
jgi:small ligand-binding sensory domain FIST